MLTENVVLAIGLSRADAAIRKRLEGPLGGGHGIGFTDFQVLAELDAVQGGRLRVTDLAKRLLLSPGGVTRAVLPLEKTGFVRRERDPRDARSSYVVLTGPGKARVNEAEETVDRVVGETLAGLLTRTDRLALLGLSERLAY